MDGWKKVSADINGDCGVVVGSMVGGRWLFV